MNMTHDEMIKVIQDEKEGKTIEFNNGLKWTERSGNEGFNFACCIYRVKQPQPLTFTETIKFIRDNPSYEIVTDENIIYRFSGSWYSDEEKEIVGDEIDFLKWREEPGESWKEFAVENLPKPFPKMKDPE